MVNLLGNAVKFTEEGKIKLDVQVEKKKGKWGVLIVRVSDTGIGIPKEKQNSIFESFTQADASMTRRFGGTGLGLTLSKQMLELLKGKIWLESEVGKGSTFSFSIPVKVLSQKAKIVEEDDNAILEERQLEKVLHKQEEKKPKSQISNKAAKDFVERSPTVLIVEDNGSALELLQRYLKKEGYAVQCSTSGEDGVLKAKFYRPDAIILEILLPGKMDGWEVLRALKSSKLTKDIPVIVCSVLSNQKKAFSLGAVEYIEKPAHERALIETLHRSIGIPADMKKEVWVVDDDKSVLILFEKLFTRQGVSVRTFDNGKDAITSFEKNQNISLMILDLLMPGVDGFDVLQKMKSSEKTKNIPVVIYTGKKLTAKDRSRLSHSYELLLQKTKETPETLLSQLNNLIPKRIVKREERPATKGNILLAEDDPSGQKLMKHLLNQLGYQVQMAETGKEVLDKLNSGSSFDIVLMDMEMPIMDGFTATREIRKNEKYKDLPVIALTAHAMKEHRNKTIESGCTDYISKPVNREKLQCLLDRYTETKTKEKIPKKTEEDPLMAELTEYFVKDLEKRIKKFNDDLMKHDQDEVTRFGHSLKGTAGSYGFPKFSALGCEIEKAAKAGEWEKVEELQKSITKEYELLGEKYHET